MKDELLAEHYAQEAARRKETPQRINPMTTDKDAVERLVRILREDILCSIDCAQAEYATCDAEYRTFAAEREAVLEAADLLEALARQATEQVSDDEAVSEARKLVNPVVMVGDFDDDEDEMVPSYPPPSKYDANKAVDLLAERIAELRAAMPATHGDDVGELVEALEQIVALENNEAYDAEAAWLAMVEIAKAALKSRQAIGEGEGGGGA